MWELDDQQVETLKSLAVTQKTFVKGGLLPQNLIDSIVDPDDLVALVRPALAKQQKKELQQLQPLSSMFTSHLHPLLNFARHQVWTILNSGGPDVRQARKATFIYGWDENVFRHVFDGFGEPGPVTIRRNAPLNPPSQPESFEAAWGTKRRREVQLVLTAGKMMDQWCSFQAFPATARRFFADSGYKQVSAKMVVEIGAIHTVDNNRIAGKECRVALFVSTVTVNSQREVLHSPLRWQSHHPLPGGADLEEHALAFYDKMHLVEAESTTAATPTTQSTQVSPQVSILNRAPSALSTPLSSALPSPRRILRSSPQISELSSSPHPQLCHKSGPTFDYE